MKSFTLQSTHITTFRRKLLLWYRTNGRDLPWRKTHDPYKILVSEIMLQQTQVDRVKEKYHSWLTRFPTVQDLAKTSPKAVLLEWSGLGYNRRALSLHTAAQQIVNDYNGIFPNTVEELMKLKGVGRYTASAIASFAFHKPTPIVDTNVKRVLGRMFLGYKTLARYIDTDEPFWVLKERILPKSKNAYDFNQGIMDFGAMTCTARQPKCGECPMQKICKSYPGILKADNELLRVKKKRKEPLYYGKPRRIWRGNILTLLKGVNTSLTVLYIGKHIQADWDATRTKWLKEILNTLEKDNMIDIQKKTDDNWLVRLPK